MARVVRVRLASAATQDLRDILKWSEEKFGKRAAARYRTLLLQALRDIEADPERPGSKKRPELMISTARTYHLSVSRSRASGAPVKTPRHFLLYRRSTEASIDVGGILHDERD